MRLFIFCSILVLPMTYGAKKARCYRERYQTDWLLAVRSQRFLPLRLSQQVSDGCMTC